MVEDSTTARLHAGISSALDDDEVLANWVCVAEIFDQDGDRGIWIDQADSATLWEILGMLEFAVQRLKGKIDMFTQISMEAQFIDDEDDDDYI